MDYFVLVKGIYDYSSLFQPRQRILRGTDEEFIFPLVKKRGAII